MDGSFFAFALIGSLVGYIVGDLQRELRYRREARNNLSLAVSRSDVPRHPDGHGTGACTDSNCDFNGHGGSLGTARREARRAAVRGDNYGLSPSPAPAGRNFRSADAPPLGKRRLEIDCF
jgi:hypothetical protein